MGQGDGAYGPSWAKGTDHWTHQIPPLRYVSKSVASESKLRFFDSFTKGGRQWNANR